MPSTTKKQAHLMSAIDHGWKPPKSSGIKVPLKVAKEFHAADKKAGKWEHPVRKKAGGRVKCSTPHPW